MEGQKLRMLDIDGLVAQLDRNAGSGIEGICIESRDFVDLTPPKGSRRYGLLSRRKVDSRVWYPLFVYYSGIEGRKARLGSITAETGVIDPEEHYCGWYEKVSLATRLPMRLKNGRRIPPCKVSVSFECYDDFAPINPNPGRKDRRKILWIGSIGWDLSTVLPTAWFRGMPVEEYERRFARSQPQPGSTQYSPSRS